MDLSDEQIEQILSSNDEKLIRLLNDAANFPLQNFKPRPDQPEEQDEQSSFFHERVNGIAVALGGNASGKTITGAAKVARFLFDTPPPRPNTPFWIVSQTFDMAIGVCWQKHLSQFIPESYIKAKTWYKMALDMPDSVVLKKHANGNNWAIHFMSAEMDRKRFQGASIGGAWIDEQVPYSILMEIWFRLRDYNFPGSFIHTLTPLEPDDQLEQKFYEQERWANTWHFYRMNLDCNKLLPEGYSEQVLENELDELKETRRTGAFASFTGQIFKQFNPRVHVIDPDKDARFRNGIPVGWYHLRGIDFGFNHPTCCLWLAKDGDGRYYVYDEYYKVEQTIDKHIAAIEEREWDFKSPYYGTSWADYGAAQERAEFRAQGLATAPALKDVRLGIAAVQNHLKVQGDGKPRLYIFKNCKNLIREMRAYSWHPHLDKPIKINDDACFVAGTLIETEEGQKRIEQVKIGDKVLTRKGYRTVLDSALTQHNAKTLTVEFSNGTTLTATPNHKIWTEEKGWTPIQFISDCDTILTVCKKKTLSLTELNGIAIQNQNIEPIESISNPITSQERQSSCIGTCGKKPMAQFHPVTISTIRTETRSTMLSTILNVCRGAFTCLCTWKAEFLTWSTWQKFGRLLLNGIALKKEESGIGNMASNAGKSEQPLKPNARTVESPMNAGLKDQGLAVMPVNQVCDERKDSTLNPEIALNAPNLSRQTAMDDLSLVGIHALRSYDGITADVYNLTVEGEHEYFANGILVKNCDALRYVIYSDQTEMKAWAPLKVTPKDRLKFG